jgi:hypothetical protein
MKRRTTKIIASLVLILLSPIIVIASIIKHPTDFVGRIAFSFQFQLFLIEFGSQK